METVTGADGRFTFPHLAAGPWRVSAAPYTKDAVNRTITLDTVGAPDVVFVVPAPRP